MTKNMKNILLTLIMIASILGTSCVVSTDRMESNLTYFQDSRTKQCYAYVNMWTGGKSWQVSVSYVPCTPEVLDAVQKDTGKTPALTSIK
jgi:hypothetical protein